MIRPYFDDVHDVCMQMSLDVVDVLVQALRKATLDEKHIFIFGNGGSGANASHFCEELATGGGAHQTDSPIKWKVKAISLTDNVPFITAVANDEGYDRIFESQLANLASATDLSIALSGSGNSPNVLRATEYANKLGLFTIGLTGFDGGELAKIVALNVHVPSSEMGIVESVHLMITHYVVSALWAYLSIDWFGSEKGK